MNMKVLKFGAVWCKECLVMKPMWSEIEESMPELETEYYDADEYPEIIEENKVETLPTFVFLDKGGKEILRLQGAQNKEDLIEKVKENIDK